MSRQSEPAVNPLVAPNRRVAVPSAPVDGKALTAPKPLHNGGFRDVSWRLADFVTAVCDSGARRVNTFFLGTHMVSQPWWDAGVPLFVSRRRLAGRVTLPHASWSHPGWAL